MSKLNVDRAVWDKRLGAVEVGMHGNPSDQHGPRPGRGSIEAIGVMYLWPR